MNSNYGKPNPPKQSSVSLNNFNFDLDLGIGSNRSKSLKDQKTPNPPSNSYSTPSYSSAQPKKWTHLPVQTPAGLPGAPPSMVGDIFGKSWGSTQPTGPSIGIVNKNPNLFGDLVTSALGQGSSNNNNVPLKNATPTPKNSSFSMSNMSNSLPKPVNTPQSASSLGSSSGSGFNLNANRSPNLGGPSIRSGVGVAASGSGIGISSSNKDPFSSLAGFGSKPSSSLNSAAKPSTIDSQDDGFGDFQNATKPSTNAFPSSGGSVGIDVDFTGSSAFSNPTPVQASGGDPMDMFFTSTTPLSGGGGGGGAAASSEIDDWGTEFGGGNHDVGGTTTELDGLPPPPAGISGSSAKGKGMDNYKQGQFADAIKWLSWALILLEKAGDGAGTVEVLSCRASCYKEVGEYKKAVADCTKVIGNNEKNVSVLVQRALLYESMEKYKLGAEDLRTVLKIDPTNRVARSTVHRLAKMAE